MPSSNSTKGLFEYRILQRENHTVLSAYGSVCVSAGEPREGWPLLTVKTEWGTQRGQMKGALSWFVPWACRAGTRDFCSAWTALGGPVQNIFFLTVHYSNSFVPNALQVLQAAVLGRLSLLVCVSDVR
jgi:hypothetical protein